MTTDWEKSERTCPHCHGTDVLVRTVEDSEGHEDDKYKCQECGEVWWVEGSDY